MLEFGRSCCLAGDDFGSLLLFILLRYSLYSDVDAYFSKLLNAFDSQTIYAAGVDIGRNIFQADDPIAMIQAVARIVHQMEKPQVVLMRMICVR